MSTFTTGRTLKDGEPVPGTGFEVERDSWLADRIRERTGPITSHPTRPVWGIPLSDDDAATIRTLSVFGAGYGGPPEHHHEQSTEVFDVKAGEITLTLDGVASRVAAGESATVETGVAHSFHNDTDERALVVTEIHSPGRLRQVLPTLGGLAHDEMRDPDDPRRRGGRAHAGLRRLAGRIHERERLADRRGQRERGGQRDRDAVGLGLRDQPRRHRV